MAIAMSVCVAEEVTILLPARNEAARIQNALDNLLETSEGARVVVVDDASTDGTSTVVRRHPIAPVLLQGEGRGLAAALNRGLGAITTPYFARVDADDLSFAGRFSRQLDTLAQDERCIACATGAREVDADGRARLRIAPDDAQRLRRELLRQNPITHGTIMARTRVVRELGGYDEGLDMAQDYDLWLRLLAVGRIRCLPEVLYERRPPQGRELRLKRHRQAYCAAKIQLRHFARTGEIAPEAVLRNVAATIWHGVRT